MHYIIRKTIRFIGLLFNIFLLVYSRFLHGEKIIYIKSEFFFNIAWYFHEGKDIGKAIKYYKRAIIANPDNHAAYLGLTITLLEKQQFTEARDFCEKANMIKSDLATNIFLHIIYESLGEAVLCGLSMQRIRKLNSDDMVAGYKQLSYTYYKLAMHKKAEYYCKEALKIRPTDLTMRYNLGDIYLADGQLDEAKEEFQQVRQFTSDKRLFNNANKKIAFISNKVGAYN